MHVLLYNYIIAADNLLRSSFVVIFFRGGVIFVSYVTVEETIKKMHDSKKKQDNL